MKSNKFFQYIIMVVILNIITISYVLSAVTVNNQKPMIENNMILTKGVETHDWMRQKNGKVLVFDKKQNIAIINKKSYVLQESIKIYDGTIKKGSQVRFNTNEKNIITELWVLK